MKNPERSILYKEIGLRLRAHRRSQKISLNQMAEKLGRSRDFVRHAELAKFRISLDKLYEFCAVLDVDPKDILPNYIPGSSTETYNKLKNK